MQQPEPISTSPDFTEDLMPAEAPQTVVKSGGVQLPQGMAATPLPTAEQPSAPAPVKPAAKATSLICEACNATFSVNLHAGVTQAVVACPTCNADNIVNG